jgi:hypothetical protein
VNTTPLEWGRQIEDGRNETNNKQIWAGTAGGSWVRSRVVTSHQSPVLGGGGGCNLAGGKTDLVSGRHPDWP